MKLPDPPKVSAENSRRSALIQEAAKGYHSRNGKWPETVQMLRLALKEINKSDRFLDELENFKLTVTNSGGLMITWDAATDSPFGLYLPALGATGK